MKKIKKDAWKKDIVVILLVVLGFELIDYNIGQLDQVPFYQDFIQLAKWLLIGGFTLHGVIGLLMNRTR